MDFNIQKSFKTFLLNTQEGQEITGEEKPCKSKAGVASNYKLPPIHSNSSNCLDAEENSPKSNYDHSDPVNSQNPTIPSQLSAPTELSAANTSTTSGIFSYPADERDQTSPDRIVHVQPKSENGNQVVSLPLLGATGTGQIYAQRSGNHERIFEVKLYRPIGPIYIYCIRLLGVKILHEYLNLDCAIVIKLFFTIIKAL